MADAEPPNGNAATGPFLVAGGSGFVGRHLVAALASTGREVRVMSRSPSPDRADGVTEVYGDVADPSSLASPLDGVGVAYYLVHSLQRADFARHDAAGAKAFAERARRAGVRRIVYLGGLGDDDDDLSAHLRSRREVEQILSDTVPTVALRAGIVVGDGSVSWEILCQLVERLPVMVTPRWVQTQTQPIALEDAVSSLVAGAAPAVADGHYEVGAPRSLSYGDMLRSVAAKKGRGLVIVQVPVLSPRLSSWWLRLITDVDLETARNLVDSMTTDVVVTDRRFEKITGVVPMPFETAADLALADRARRRRRGAKA